MLVLFDIDGTLVDAMDIENEFYPKAVSETLGIQGFSTDWESYPNPSDPGIVRSVVEKEFNRETTAEELQKCEECFANYVYQNRREYFPIKGALELYHYFINDPTITVGIVTAAWRKVALLKLEHSCFEIGKTLLLTSSEYEDKYDAIVAAHKELSISPDSSQKRLYIGDSTSDCRDAIKAGFKFLGVGKKWTEANSFNAMGVLDFSNLESVLRKVASVF